MNNDDATASLASAVGICILAFVVLNFVGLWKVFTKAGKPG